MYRAYPNFAEAIPVKAQASSGIRPHMSRSLQRSSPLDDNCVNDRHLTIREKGSPLCTTTESRSSVCARKVLDPAPVRVIRAV
jgi:hypothetical protein